MFGYYFSLTKKNPSHNQGRAKVASDPSSCGAFKAQSEPAMTRPWPSTRVLSPGSIRTMKRLRNASEAATEHFPSPSENVFSFRNYGRVGVIIYPVCYGVFELPRKIKKLSIENSQDNPTRLLLAPRNAFFSHYSTRVRRACAATHTVRLSTLSVLVGTIWSKCYVIHRFHI